MTEFISETNKNYNQMLGREDNDENKIIKMLLYYFEQYYIERNDVEQNEGGQ
jgi:hypothetical protein